MTDAVLKPDRPKLERLKKRADFLACAKGAVCARGALLVQARARSDGSSLVRAGFTATRRVGGAVVRNRAKRRMREAARALLPDLARPGFDYVFIARGGAPTRPWPRLLDDMKSALIRLAADPGADLNPPADASRPRSADPAPDPNA
ncbi:ribonuclease P protein component [Phenylobacterium immobile]|uniref:ribonuclease P protein component n=1 Tax=Phenylobacterium immobile TaxID=21 RepID=UPI000A74CAAA|nr:ribonuclease P protein component [Phenylobacterium immobile]